MQPATIQRPARRLAVAFVVRLGVLLPVGSSSLSRRRCSRRIRATAAGLRVAPLIAIGDWRTAAAWSSARWPRSLVIDARHRDHRRAGRWSAGVGWLLRSAQARSTSCCLRRPYRRCNSRRRWASGSGSPRRGRGSNCGGRLRCGLSRRIGAASRACRCMSRRSVSSSRIGGLCGCCRRRYSGALPVLSHEARHGASDAVRARFDRTLLVFALASASVVIVFAAPLVSWTYGEGFAGAVVPLVWTGIRLVPRS